MRPASYTRASSIKFITSHILRMVKKIKTFKKGRICKLKGCRQTLSIYNSGIYCYLHKHPLIYKAISTSVSNLQ